MKWTSEELAEMAAYDATAEVEDLTIEELTAARKRDQQAYRQKNKEAIAEYQQAYYQKNKEAALR